ncbi:hypothetical protein DTO166G4_3181 [Paecilomyces variotii]|nr:hypothetical protein DTO166G4_3181 [Paecilomyces variotii]KAJ9233833.1 hypothetical protein DTO166G5_5494 [Paecilomyces variotii]
MYYRKGGDGRAKYSVPLAPAATQWLAEYQRLVFLPCRARTQGLVLRGCFDLPGTIEARNTRGPPDLEETADLPFIVTPFLDSKARGRSDRISDCCYKTIAHD